MCSGNEVIQGGSTEKLGMVRAGQDSDAGKTDGFPVLRLNRVPNKTGRGKKGIIRQFLSYSSSQLSGILSTMPYVRRKNWFSLYSKTTLSCEFSVVHQ